MTRVIPKIFKAIRQYSLSPTLEKYVSKLSERYTTLEQEIMRNEEGSDFQKLQDMASDIKDPVTVWRSLLEKRKNVEILTEMSRDPDIRDMALEDIGKEQKEMEKLEDEIYNLLMSSNEQNEENSVILEVRPGAGGDDAAIFASELFSMYNLYSQSKGWDISTSQAEREGNKLKLGSVKINGFGVFDQLQFEIGVHRVQRIPVTEKNSRIHTSTAAVSVLIDNKKHKIDICPKDLRIDTFRSSGAGGQHVNKTESAVRIVHLPSGITVECQDERSQHMNKERAMETLYQKLNNLKDTREANLISTLKKKQIGNSERCEKIRTYNFPSDRIVDHRIGLTLYGISSMLNGSLLCKFIENLRIRQQEDLLLDLEKELNK